MWDEILCTIRFVNLSATLLCDHLLGFAQLVRRRFSTFALRYWFPFSYGTKYAVNVVADTCVVCVSACAFCNPIDRCFDILAKFVRIKF